MTEKRVLADEHVPTPVVSVLKSLGNDIVRSKAVLPEGADDQQLLEFARQNNRVIVTADKQFTVIDGDVVTDHAGVVYVDQSALQTRPADVAEGVTQIFETVPAEERIGSEFYLSHWMNQP